MSKKNIILFLNENPLPKVFTQGTIAGKELRLRAAIDQIDEVHVIARRGKTVEIKKEQHIGKLEKKIHVHLLPLWPYYLAGIGHLLWGMYYCLKLRPLTIEAESPIISGPAAVVLGNFFNKVSIVEVRSSYNELIKQKVKWIPYQFKKIVLNFVYVKTLKNATTVIVNSHYYQKQLKFLGLKSVEINPGIQSLGKLNPHPKTSIITLGFLGRLTAEKGCHYLIEAVNLIINKYHDTAVEVLVAGDGPQKQELENLVKKYKLDKNIRFLGFTDSYQFLNNISILINTTTVKAPLEMANAEAAYMGIPVICFGNKNYPETVIHNKTGIKIPERDSIKLADAIRTLIKDPQKYLQLSKSTKALYKQNYQFVDQVTKLEKLYQSLNIF